MSGAGYDVVVDVDDEVDLHALIASLSSSAAKSDYPNI
jgi:hypothetical protein